MFADSVGSAVSAVLEFAAVDSADVVCVGLEVLSDAVRFEVAWLSAVVVSVIGLGCLSSSAMLIHCEVEVSIDVRGLSSGLDLAVHHFVREISLYEWPSLCLDIAGCCSVASCWSVGNVESFLL